MYLIKTLIGIMIGIAITLLILITNEWPPKDSQTYYHDYET